MKRLKKIPDKTICEAWLAYAELPSDTLIPLIYKYQGARSVFDTIVNKKENIGFLSSEQQKKLFSGADDTTLENFSVLINQHNILSASILDSEYPDSIRHIEDPPPILFYQGNLEVLNHKRRIAMVGSRSASYTGLRNTRSIANELSSQGVSIISGLAYGIDTQSHRGCLDGGSPTIAVVGSGLDKTYPDGNLSLKIEIVEKNGVIVSEYAPTVKPYGYHFPYRNRIISGLSHAVVLMEARIRSGSMTTIDHALKQGKDVFCYPGDPESILFEGNRILLRDGARFFTTAKDILEDMNWLDNPSYVRQNIDCSTEKCPDNPAEKAVVQALEKGTLSFEQIISVTGLSSSELMSTITLLQIKKMVELLPGKKYRISHQ